MTIAILGWGSLIWDQESEQAKAFEESCRGKWKLAEGLELPLEFSRISKSRAFALTLVIDKKHGTDCTVQYIESKRAELNDVICDLRCREGTVWKHIGYWKDSKENSGHLFSDRIGEWAKKATLDAVVWTALQNNYSDIKEEEFSLDNAMRHLRGLSCEGKHEARKYLTNAPDEVKTKLREQVNINSPFD